MQSNEQLLLFLNCPRSLKKLFEEANIPTEKIANRVIPDFAIWEQEPNDVCFDLAAYDKSTTLPSFFKAKYSCYGLKRVAIKRQSK